VHQAARAAEDIRVPPVCHQQGREGINFEQADSQCPLGVSHSRCLRCDCHPKSFRVVTGDCQNVRKFFIAKPETVFDNFLEIFCVEDLISTLLLF
jgi:hypothetical protein